MQRLILTILLGILFCSCQGQSEKYEYYRFRKQVSPSGKYVIYDYARYGPMAFSSDITGTELFEIDQKFVEGEGEKISGAISEWISNDTLLVFNFKSDLKQPKDTLPIKTEYSRLGDFVVKTLFYKSNSGGRDIYDFDSVATSSDSIFVRVLLNNKEKKVLGFPLGGTSIKTKSDSLVHIEIDGRLNKSMSFVYKNPDGTFTTGLPEVGTTWYDLTPVKNISPTGLTKRKIFWEE